MVADLLAEEGLTLVDDPNYDPYRAPIIQKDKEMLPMAEVNKLLNLDSCPEKMICRCEQVTEGTIIDAITRGIPINTVDAVKRRTRASMGFCQGAFCRPRFTEVVERELGIKLDTRTDIEAEGDTRVTRQEFVAYCKAQEAAE